MTNSSIKQFNLNEWQNHYARFNHVPEYLGGDIWYSIMFGYKPNFAELPDAWVKVLHEPSSTVHIFYVKLESVNDLDKEVMCKHGVKLYLPHLNMLLKDKVANVLGENYRGLDAKIFKNFSLNEESYNGLIYPPICLKNGLEIFNASFCTSSRADSVFIGCIDPNLYKEKGVYSSEPLSKMEISVMTPFYFEHNTRMFNFDPLFNQLRELIIKVKPEEKGTVYEFGLPEAPYLSFTV